ncbi:MAG TPA: hypothetical protein VJT31_12355 [Rugosimonospora sp.]|nr:hypothetical protein [Rugosimonospora sp.]
MNRVTRLLTLGGTTLATIAATAAITGSAAHAAPAATGGQAHPNDPIVCVTTWSGTSATSNCLGFGFWNQVIHCQGIARPVLGPVINGTGGYTGHCPAGHPVNDAGVDFL